ncbi:hydrolase, TatD family [Luminiphilus syltensis NOR5-1B]|uniref:Hydrolase, TatD family n=1 Tax=Luminiphilus syltensis NOR5-1B TaxID=565045 RepID=B8KQZ8_9GAMM|nr:TatD family hydrolase [Luminiphilus syltensis]EED35370.1 hydrolase, TatD family [Luminiphilus syltensis NOR5-1B]
MGRKVKVPIPTFVTPLIETHCHLDYLDGDALTQTIDEAHRVGVERIVTIAVSPDNQNRVQQLTDQYSTVWGTQGIHPHEANQWSPAVLEQVRTGAQHPRIVAIGEIGLDYFYEHSDRKQQQIAFEQQLQLAESMKLPVVIHTREADTDTESILSSHRPDTHSPGVIHSFTSGIKLAEYCLERGFFLGFNGIATFKNADNVREVIEATPIDQIVLETDSPYLTPVPYRGRQNAPYYLPFIAQKIAEIKHVDVEELLHVARENSMKLFFSHDH